MLTRRDGFGAPDFRPKIFFLIGPAFADSTFSLDLKSENSRGAGWFLSAFGLHFD
jgi:hypothetical protein